MDNSEKKVVSFFLTGDTMDKLDAVCASQRRNRSLQIAFMVDEEFARLFPQLISLVDAMAAEAEAVEKPTAPRG